MFDVPVTRLTVTRLMRTVCRHDAQPTNNCQPKQHQRNNKTTSHKTDPFVHVVEHRKNCGFMCLFAAIAEFHENAQNERSDAYFRVQ